MKQNNRGEIILDHFNIEDASKYNDENNVHTISGDNYKNCPNCGQGLIPFKYGLCICGKQVEFRKFLITDEI